MNIYRFYGHFLPISFNYKDFGQVMYENNVTQKYLVLKIQSRKGIIYEFNYSENKCEVYAKVKTSIYYSWIDEFDNKDDYETFCRTFKNKKYYFEKGRLIKEERFK
uniref:Uncharacterized protein n=1 Tax=Pisolithus tinctorius TaxID=37468 RepID=A0A873QJS7_PISTI|nr:hypothetical protein J6738_mgp16 [Pisolithus tinctorius]QPA36172.1 hypothetical protein [Pisolithus tinctorius]